MHRLAKRLHLILTIVVLIFNYLTIAKAYGQNSFNYQPRKVTSGDSRKLLTALEMQLELEFEKSNSPSYSESVNNNHIQLLSLVKKGLIIQDDSLQLFVDRIFERLVNNTKLNERPARVLILKDPRKNAASCGEGTILVTIGLLGKIVTEGQLAFVIAHEISHYALSHDQKRNKYLFSKQNKEIYQSSKKGFKKKDLSLNTVAQYRDFLNGVMRLARDSEKEADSLALVLVKNSRYEQRNAISVLPLLPEEDADSVDYNIFLAFDHSQFPLQENWFNKRWSLFNKEISSTFLFNMDSLKTHPEINSRLAILEPLIETSGDPTDYQSTDFVDACIKISKYEVVESAYFNRQYDRGIHQALKLLKEDYSNEYLVSKVTKMLLEIYLVGYAKKYVNQYTTDYSGELRAVNNFLLNLSMDQTLLIAYYFLLENFNANNQYHYYLMWNIYSALGMSTEVDSIRSVYLDKFGKEKYYFSMQKGITIKPH